MPKPRKKRTSDDETPESTGGGPAVRPIWSGTITFGLVSIPVDLLSGVRPRQTAMKLIDKEGHPLGRQYHCSKEGTRLEYDDLIRGYETEEGEIIPITDEEFESVAPEMSADIDLRSFVKADQIPPVYFQRPYYLAPAGKSAKAYNLLAATMERTGRVGIGSFVMRGHEYLVAIVSDNGVLRADTLRYADEVRTPESIGLPNRIKAPEKLVSQFAREIEDLRRDELSLKELEDTEAEDLLALVKAKEKDSKSVIHQADLEADDEEPAAESAEIIDLMALLRKSLSPKAVVRNAESGPPISLAERRAAREGVPRRIAAKASVATKSSPRKKPPAKKSRKRGD